MSYEPRKAVQSASAWVHCEAGKDKCKHVPSARSHTRRISAVLGNDTAEADQPKSAAGRGTKAGRDDGFSVFALSKRERRAPGTEVQLAAQLRSRVATVQSDDRLPKFVGNFRAALARCSPLFKQSASTDQIIRSRRHSLNLPANLLMAHAILPKAHGSLGIGIGLDRAGTSSGGISTCSCENPMRTVPTGG